ncbi:hypothetical protein [Actinophytocola oryzae]|uniref:Uncharacterized protein n=1 Tax=Actinophytocola oryzae TaxID=502181 RepID=A0A4V3FRH0_9PSEU|nr:hypothetical protein [Actinophytocola oryzae]TDV43551.1 hypothetical protein CLV71_11513 [Actinophytocola oryzae]
MARLATALHETGLDPGEVLDECYGVEFPREFFVLAEADPTLLFDVTNQPWKLALPHPPATAAPMAALEREIFSRDGDLLPLGRCLDIDAGFGGLFLCYRLTDLAADRTTVYSVEQHPTATSPIVPRADSLLAALHEHHTAHLARTAAEDRRTAASGEDTRLARKYLTRIAELRRRVSARGRG